MSAPSVVIVNYNGGTHLQRCLASVAAHAPASSIIVVDNASTDGSGAIAARAPGVRLIGNSRNVGFAAAVNQGVAAAPPGGSVLLLNPDCEITSRAIEVLAGELDAQPACAIAAPTVLDEDGSVQGSVRGDPTMLTGLFGRTTLLTRLFPKAALAARNVQRYTSEESRSVDWVSGACMLVRRAAFEAVGGFDERYFLYWEDADLCRRLRAAGHTIRFVPRATVVHAGGRSSESARTLSVRAFHESAYLYYRTHVARNAVTRAVARILLALRLQWKLAALRTARR
ncbi:MAG: glycosyltransferase family 2 protein [Vicinamibacterales bacterium]